MANSVIGALRVTLGLDSAQFTSGVKTAESRLAKFGTALKVGLAAAAAAGVAAMGALAVGIKGAIDHADDMSKMAQKIGIPIDELSRLKHAADLSGVSLDGLGTGLRKLSQNMQETAKGAKNAASQAFAALGISVKNADGTLKSSSSVMTEVAGKFAIMDNGAQKTALAMAIFGKAGADLIPMLNAGASGIAAMMAEADRLGIVISSSTGRAAEAFNDNLSRIGTTTSALQMKIAAELLPVLELLSEEFMKFANNGELVTSVASGMVGALGFIANEIAQLAILANRLNVEILGVVEAFRRLKSGDFSGAWAAFQEGQDASARMAAEMKANIQSIFDGTNVSQGGIQRRIDDAFGDAGAGAGKKFIAEFTGATGGGKIKAAIDPMVAEAARVFDATRTPLENYQAQIARLNDLLAAGKINQDTYNRAVLQAQDAFDAAEKAGKKSGSVLESIGQSIASSFSNAFMSLLDGSRKVGEVLKDLLKQIASMLLNKAFSSIFGSLFSGFTGGLKIPGFANGGSILPGGTGGIDSQLVMFRKSPNERVDITKPGQSAGGSMHVTVGLASDGALNIMPEVRSVASGEAAKATGALAKRVPSMAVGAVEEGKFRRLRPQGALG